MLMQNTLSELRYFEHDDNSLLFSGQLIKMYEGVATIRKIPLTIKSVNFREGHTKDPTSGEKYLYGAIMGLKNVLAEVQVS